jgi:cytochrome c-type biogenesis protein CcmH
MSYLTYVPMLLLAAACLAPAAFLFWRPGQARGRRESALALHRAQLADLERDLAEGRLAPAEHAGAALEVQRRMLRAAEGAEPEVASGGGTALAAMLGLIPALALLLYLVGGQPGMPSVPHAELVAAQKQEAERASVLADQLRDRLKALDPKSDMARRGYVMLGELEVGRGDLAAAAAAWRTALAAGFDPMLAARTADALSAAAGKVTPEAAALFRRALAEAPPDAPWRSYAEQRLASAGG